MIEHIGVTFGARGIEAAKDYAAGLAAENEFSLFECVKHIADRLDLSGDDLLRLVEETRGAQEYLEQLAATLEELEAGSH